MPSLSQQWKAAKAAWDDDTSPESPGARFGLMFDPTYYLLRATDKKLGQKYHDVITKSGDEMNRTLSSALGTDDRNGWAANKPASTIGLLASAYYGGSALGGLGNGGGSVGSGPGGSMTSADFTAGYDPALLGKTPFGLQSGGGLGMFGGGGAGGLQGLGGGNAGALAQSGGISGGAGMGSATAPAGFDIQSLMGKGGFGSMPGMSTGVPAQSPQYNPPPQQLPGPEPITQTPDIGKTSLTSRVMGGLGRARDALTPIDPRVSEGMDPAYVKQLRNQAMLRMGLGMMANANSGGSFGEALAAGLGQGVGGFNKDVEGAYQRGVEARAEKRDEDRLALADKRYEAERTYRQGRDSEADRDDERDFEALKDWRESQAKRVRAAEVEGRIPAGYRKSKDGNLEPIPGGPADPAGPAARKAAQSLRKEFRGLQSVKDYEAALPMVESAKKAPDTGYGDMDLIYAVGKTLDPGSVVREGELALTIAAGSPIERIIGTTRFTIGNGGRLTPESRKQLIEMLEGRVNSYKQLYDRDFQQYSQYATQTGISPELIVGTPAERAYDVPVNEDLSTLSDEELRRIANGG